MSHCGKDETGKNALGGRYLNNRRLGKNATKLFTLELLGHSGDRAKAISIHTRTQKKTHRVTRLPHDREVADLITTVNEPKRLHLRCVRIDSTCWRPLAAKWREYPEAGQYLEPGWVCPSLCSCTNVITIYYVVILFDNSEGNTCIAERDVTNQCNNNKMSTMSCIF